MWEYPSIVPGQDAGVARTPQAVISRYRKSLLRQNFEPLFGKILKLIGSSEKVSSKKLKFEFSRGESLPDPGLGTLEEDALPAPSRHLSARTA